VNNPAPLAAACIALSAGAGDVLAQSQTPLTGHYPPGQSGIRGASTPDSGFVYTNFSRFFSNLEVMDASGDAAQSLDELRYANISMLAWTTDWQVFGMRYGAVAGIPFGTGNLRPAAQEEESTELGLGDVLITPLALYGKSERADFQVQLTLWSASGRFSPGADDNRGTGFQALVYSFGGVFYPSGDREAWSLSAIARVEQNFEQDGSGITPGDDVVIDWGIGKIVRAWQRPVDLGVSGFAVWQIDSQTGGPASTDIGHYRLFGIGPEVSVPLTERLSLRGRAHWEFGARNIVSGNNFWLIVGFRF
jgi:hypothetical protein